MGNSSNNLEIERKFLIEYPNFDILDFNSKIDISQAYLVRENPEVERRIRSWSENDTTRYFYTEKKFLTGFTRQELETEISKQDYDILKLEVDKSLVIVNKSRYTINVDKLTFEIDVYPFSKKYAIMEVELDNENQDYNPPKYINILKEVTGLKEYSNISICTAKKLSLN